MTTKWKQRVWITQQCNAKEVMQGLQEAECWRFHKKSPKGESVDSEWNGCTIKASSNAEAQKGFFP